MHNDIMTVAKIVNKAKDLLKAENEVTNLKTKVTVTREKMTEGSISYGIIYKVVDQTSVIRNKRATVVVYADGDFHCEYSGFKSEEDILASLEK